MRKANRKATVTETKAKKKLQFRKKIYDNVHGYIDITEPERQLIDTPLFQRLRRVAHLGLADYVYPGATHSRFSHCLGSMNVMHKLCLPLIDLEVLTYDDLSALRLAALLHDVGHYPFSHVTERTMRRLYGDQAKHELVGEFILRKTSLRKAVGRVCKPDIIRSIMRHDYERPLFQYLVSSSLDVDKMDYLQRDSLHTGVAYGAFDVDRLLTSLVPDKGKNPTRLIVTRKGRQAIEDFLLGRYHMFQSVYYHKTVVAFELMLDRIIEDLIARKALPDLQGLMKGIQRDERWLANYDDAFVWNVMKTTKNANPVTRELIRMLLSRESLKMADEKLTLSPDAIPGVHEAMAKDDLSHWLSGPSGVSESWIFYKQQPPTTFLEIEDDETVHVETTNGKTIRIMDDPTSIIKKLWDSQFRAYRIYTRDHKSRELIEATLRKRMKS